MAKKSTKATRVASRVQARKAGRIFARHHPTRVSRVQARKNARISARRNPPPAAKARAWSPDEAVACCSARAVAESLRLTLGVTVADADVLALHAAAGGHPDNGAPILDVLRAAQEYGLGGHKPVAFQCIAGPLSAASERVVSQLVLGLDDPPHAIVADATTWWSWGEPHAPADFPGAVIEECWAVTW